MKLKCEKFRERDSVLEKYHELEKPKQYIIIKIYEKNNFTFAVMYDPDDGQISETTIDNLKIIPQKQ